VFEYVRIYKCIIVCMCEKVCTCVNDIRITRVFSLNRPQAPVDGRGQGIAGKGQKEEPHWRPFLLQI
jgi:hypothetical protein